MVFELYYTSGGEGMRRWGGGGGGGFCTVGASDGMPRGLWERLESLSGYRHVGAAGGGGNPVSFGHCVVEVGGMKYHVLSRACDAGVDHTQRPNAFAHHVAVGAREMARGGPAWMLRQPGVMADTWDGQVGPIAPRTLPQGGPAEGGVCRLWKEVTGDAGWGGRLTEAFSTKAATPVCVVFAAGMDMLGLIGEAIALLPQELRWGVTFNTHFTTMPTSAGCLWRCCLAGTPAATSGLRYAANGGLVVDLTKALGPAPGGAYAEYARTGRGRPAAGGPATAAKRAVGIAGVKAADAVVEEEAQYEQPSHLPEEAIEEVPPVEEEAADRVAPVRSRKRKRVAVGMLEEITGRAAEREAAARRRRAMWMIGGALAAIAAGMGLVWWAASGRHAEMTTEEEVRPTTHTAVASRPGIPPVAPSPVTLINPEAPPPDLAMAVTKVALTGEMTAPEAGGGMHDPSQVFKLDPGQVGNAPVRSMELHLLGGSPYAAKAVGGVMTADVGPGARSAQIRWQDKDAPAGTAWTAATVSLTDDGLDLEWKAGFLLTHPEALPTVYWRLRGGTILGLARETPTTGDPPLATRFYFERWAGKGVDFTQESGATGVPVALPEGSTVVATDLPLGWEQAASQTGGAATQAGEAPGQVVEIRKPGEDATATASFELLFRGGFTEIVSTYGQKRSQAAAALKDTQEALAGLATGDPPEKKQRLEAQAARYKQALAGYNELQKFQVAVLLSGVRVGTLPMVRGAATTAP